jgi:hypothetical protein
MRRTLTSLGVASCRLRQPREVVQPMHHGIQQRNAQGFQEVSPLYREAHQNRGQRFVRILYGNMQASAIATVHILQRRIEP